MQKVTVENDKADDISESSETSTDTSDTSDSSSSNSEIVTECRKSFKEKLALQQPLLEKLNNAKTSKTLCSILARLSLPRLRIILQVCKKVYSGKLTEGIKKTPDLFKKKKDHLNDTLDGVSASRLRKNETLEILKGLSSENDGKLFRKLLAYNQYCH